MNLFEDVTFLKNSDQAETYLKGMVHVFAMVVSNTPESVIESHIEAVIRRMHDLVDSELYGLPL